MSEKKPGATAAQQSSDQGDGLELAKESTTVVVPKENTAVSEETKSLLVAPGDKNGDETTKPSSNNDETKPSFFERLSDCVDNPLSCCFPEEVAAYQRLEQAQMNADVEQGEDEPTEEQKWAKANPELAERKARVAKREQLRNQRFGKSNRLVK